MCGRPFLPGRCLRSGRWAVGLGVPTDERCRARRARAPSEGARMSSHWPTSGLRGSAGRKRMSSGPPRAQRPAPPPPRGVPRAESASVRARLGPRMCKMAPSPFPHRGGFADEMGPCLFAALWLALPLGTPHPELPAPERPPFLFPLPPGPPPSSDTWGDSAFETDSWPREDGVRSHRAPGPGLAGSGFTFWAVIHSE